MRWMDKNMTKNKRHWFDNNPKKSTEKDYSKDNPRPERTQPHHALSCTEKKRDDMRRGAGEKI